MNFLRDTAFLNVAINVIILVLVIFANKEALRRLSKLLRILDNGAYFDCPYYQDSAEKVLKSAEISKLKGGETHGRSNER